MCHILDKQCFFLAIVSIYVINIILIHSDLKLHST